MKQQSDKVAVSYPEAIVGLGVVLQKLNEALEPYEGYAMLHGQAPDTLDSIRDVDWLSAQIQIGFDPRLSKRDMPSPAPPSEDTDREPS
jgi:hypothetical protein